MHELLNDTVNRKAAEAFSKQSVIFDEIYNDDAIIQYERARVRSHAISLLPPGASILELNCGTGEDAIFFASQACKVHATDIAEGMMQKTKEKISASLYKENITTEICSYTDLYNLENRGPFDMIFSDFGGLNCTDQLDKVLASFSPLLKPGGIVTLVIIPKFCLWETLLLFKGQFKTAFRRFLARKGRTAHIEGVYFKCWYYNPKYIQKNLKNFTTVKLEGLCTLVPPSYMQGFAEKHPRLFRFLCKKEDQLKAKRFWRSIGDYYIISLKKKLAC